MKKDFTDNKDIQAAQATEIPESWKASEENIRKARQEQTGLFAKFKKRFREEDKA